MYNVTKDINSEGSTFNYLLPGIHDDVELVNVEYKRSPDNDNPFMVFTFEKDGKTVTLTEWEPSDQDPKQLDQKRNNQMVRVKHIVTKFIPEDKYEFRVTSFEDFCKRTIELLGTSYKGVKVRLKVTYNNKNYSTVPRYVKFIERMDVPKEKSKLEIYDIDKMVKDVADKETPTTTNPFDEEKEVKEPELVESTTSDDLPF